MIPSFSLSSGGQIPAIGLGLWKIPQTETPRVIQDAIAAGYRHFDAACDYGNEAEAGAGFQAAFQAGLCRREDLWITSKLWNTYHAAKHVRSACERTLHDLGVDFLDLYLVHFPIPLAYVPFEERYPPGWFHDPAAPSPKMEFAKVPFHETWRAMEDLVRSGLVRNIGVCNVTTGMIRDLLTYAEIRPAVLQVEAHPYLTQDKLLRYCQQEEIAFTAFSPFGSLSYVSLGMASPNESVMEEAAVTHAAQRTGKTPAQVLLRWGVQRGTSVVPKTANPERLRENLALFDFSLTEDEMNAISGLNRNRRYNDPGSFCESVFHTFCPVYE
ncbi:MAG: D-xylose reductase [Verrucomicrobia bacterium]|nr:MAG: D-xylose reductase [Verrucomicrobiota bacterium]